MATVLRCSRVRFARPSAPALGAHAPFFSDDEQQQQHQQHRTRPAGVHAVHLLCACTARQSSRGIMTNAVQISPDHRRLAWHRSHARALHATVPRESTVILVGGLGVAGALMGINYSIEAWNAFQKSRAKQAADEEKYGTNSDSGGASGTNDGEDTTASGHSTYYAKRFYDGPFEEEMSKREAALILGVRESASAKRIKNAHRKLVILNHPDTGGSTYISTKLNEAKELLLKTADDDE